MRKKDFDYGTVTQDNIREVQRIWLTYRDAWVAFGKIKCPQISEDSLKTLFTKERTSQLKGFIFEL
jgi:hypothetical protein